MTKHTSDKHKSHKSEKSHKDKHRKSKHSSDAKHSKRHYSDSESDSDSDSSDSNDEQNTNNDNNKFKRINEDDYFLKMIEFRVWMKISKNILFEDIPGEESRKLFLKEFIPLYNKQNLPNIYYNGIPIDIKNQCIKTKHTWNMKLTTNEIDQLASTADEVDITTETPKESAWKHVKSSNSNSNSNDRNGDRSNSHSHGDGGGNHSGGNHGNRYEKKSVDYGNSEPSYYGPSSGSSAGGAGSGGGSGTSNGTSNGNVRVDDRARGREYQNQVKNYLEDGGAGSGRDTNASGRERIMEQKHERAHRTHGAANDREESKYSGSGGLNENDLYGGHNNDFEVTKARLERSRNIRNQSSVDKIQAYSDRENETITKFKDQLNSNSNTGTSYTGRAMVPPRT